MGVESVMEGQKFYTPKEVAARWKVSTYFVRRIFAKEQGVLVLGRKDRVHLRIPEEVLDRVERRERVA